MLVVVVFGLVDDVVGDGEPGRCEWHEQRELLSLLLVVVVLYCYGYYYYY